MLYNARVENNYPPTNPQSNYQRGGAGGTGWVRPPGVYFELIGESFNLIKAQLGVWLTVSFITVLISYGLSIGLNLGVNVAFFGSALGPSESQGADLGKVILSSIASILGGTISSAVMMSFFCGFGRMAILQSQGQTLTIRDAFVPFRNFGAVLGTSLIYSIATTFGFVFCLIPGIYLTGRLCLATYYAGIRGDSTGSALTEAWNVSKPHAWGLFGLFLVAGLVSGLGAILCGVGIFFTFPIAGMVMGLTYATFAQQQNPVTPA